METASHFGVGVGADCARIDCAFRIPNAIGIAIAAAPAIARYTFFARFNFRAIRFRTIVSTRFASIDAGRVTKVCPVIAGFKATSRAAGRPALLREHYPLHGGRLSIDDLQQDARRSFRLPATLFPITQGGCVDPEALRELALRHAQLSPNPLYIDAR